MRHTNQRLHATATSVSPTHSRHKTPDTRLFRRLGMSLVEGITAVSLLLAPSSVFAQGKGAEAAKAVADGAVAARPTSKEDLQKLPKVSLTEMKALAEETCRKYFCSQGDQGFTWVTSVSGIKISNGVLLAGAAIERERANVLITVNRQIVAVIDLKPLADLYMTATGNELKYVRLVVEQGTHPAVGSYIGLFVVPVGTPNGEIAEGVPVLSRAYAGGTVYKEPEKLLAMR